MRSGVVNIGATVLLAIVMVATIVAACDSAGRSGSAGGSAAAPTSPGPTAEPTGTTATATGTPTESVASSADPAPTGSAGSSTPASEPPPATLAADGGEPAIGQLGSYTWLDGGSDSPWLPGTPLTVGAGEPLTVTIGGGVAVADWSARRVTAGTTDGSGAVALGQAAGPPVTFAAPAAGTWSLEVTVRFADDLGLATYYWRLTVR
jgi:hypothetical protein